MKHTIIPIIISVVALVVALLANVQPPVHLGGTVENFPKLFSNGLRIGNFSGNVLGNTLITNVQCASKAFALTSNLAVNATTTFDLSLTGAAATSTTQVFLAGAASSSAQTLQVTASPSSTAGVVSVLLNSKGGTWNGTATTTYSVCLLQF